MTTPAAHRKTLRVGLLGPVHNLHPRRTHDFVSAMVVTQVYERPFVEGATGQPLVPLVFSEPLRDESAGGAGTAYSAAVRSGMRFSDGTELAAAHVAASLAATEVVAREASVEARGERVYFRLRQPNPRFDLTLTQTYCGIALERGGELLGSGPYRVAPGSSAESLRLERNPHYRGAVPIDEVVFTVYPPAADGSAERLVQAVESGAVDFTNLLSRDDVGKLRHARKWFQPGNSTAILYFNTERPFLAEPAVRRALVQAVDRRAIAQISYSNALAFTATGLLPPMLDTSRDGLGFNLARARAELADAGGDRAAAPLRLLVIWGPRPYLPHPRPVGEAIARQLGALGVAVDVSQAADSDDYYRRVGGGDYDMLLAGWITDTVDPADFFEANLSSDLIPALDKQMATRANRSRYRNAAMDRALAHFRSERSADAKGEVLRLLREEVPLLPLMYGPTVVAHSWRVKNFEPTPIGLPDFSKLDV